MKTKYYILFIFAMTTIGCKDVAKSSEGKTQLEVADSVQTESTNSDDSKNGGQTDTITSPKIIKQVDTTKNVIDEWTGIREVNLVLNEFEVRDSSSYNLLKSLVKREKRCLNSNISTLHWTFFKWQDNVYHLTLSSDVGKGEYLGYFIIDNMLFLTTEKLPGQFKNTGETKEFTFKDKKSPNPEDYSTYFISSLDGQMQMVKSFPLPCD